MDTGEPSKCSRAAMQTITHTGTGNIFANEGGNATNYLQDGNDNRQIINPGVYHEGLSSITNNNYLPPERQETPPNPTSNVPFRRDPDFINRTDLTDQINEKLAPPASRVALVGLGGVGKSQLAIEYSYRVREQSPETWLLWIHASNAARFEQSVRDIADLVKIRGRENPRADIFALFRNWLHDARKGRWIVILDNADDASFLVDRGLTATSRSLIDCLPVCDHGSILITTRSEPAALQLVERSDMISILEMDEEHAVMLLRKKLNLRTIETSETDLAELASALEYMPLGITQAAAFINQRRGRCSVRHYLDKLHQSDQSKTSILDKEEGDLRRDREARNSIMLTWQISFEHIHRIRPSAAQLLSLMSFSDRQAIPEMLLRVTRNGQEAYRLADDSGDDEPLRETTAFDDYTDSDDSDDSNGPDDSVSLDNSIDGFEDDVSMLAGYSFVSISASDASTFEMHRLVQLATYKWLRAEGRLERWKERYVHNLRAVFPAPLLREDREKCRILMPHVKVACGLELKKGEALSSWACLIDLASLYAAVQWMLSDASDMCLRCMQVMTKEFGKEYGSTLYVMEKLAMFYSSQQRWSEAEELQLKVVEARRRVSGESHVDTLASMGSLALTYSLQRRWSEAEELCTKVIETQRRLLGDSHPATLITMARLASIYCEQERLSEAEELLVKVLEVRASLTGDSDSATMTVMAYLGWTYHQQGRLAEAEELLVRAVEGKTRLLGESHPSTMFVIHILAVVYLGQGRLHEVGELLVKTTEAARRTSSELHVLKLRCMMSVSELYRRQRRLEEAEDIEMRASLLESELSQPR